MPKSQGRGIAVIGLIVSIGALLTAISSTVATWKTVKSSADNPRFEFTRSNELLTVHQFGGTSFDPSFLTLSCEHEDANSTIFRTSPKEITLTPNIVSAPDSQAQHLRSYTAKGVGQHLSDSGCDAGVLIRIIIHSVGEKEWLEVMTWRDPG